MNKLLAPLLIALLIIALLWRFTSYWPLVNTKQQTTNNQKIEPTVIEIDKQKEPNDFLPRETDGDKDIQVKDLDWNVIGEYSDEEIKNAKNTLEKFVEENN